MCLILYKNHRISKKEIAKEDIECYKVLEKYKFLGKFTRYKTIVIFFKIKLGKQYSSKFEFGSETYFDKYLRCFSKRRTIEKGLHSFAKLKDAKAFCKDQFNLSLNHVIVKCYIPKGAEYYKGIFNEYEAYVSNKLKYTTEILNIEKLELNKKVNLMFDDILKD